MCNDESKDDCISKYLHYNLNRINMYSHGLENMGVSLRRGKALIVIIHRNTHENDIFAG